MRERETKRERESEGQTEIKREKGRYRDIEIIRK